MKKILVAGSVLAFSAALGATQLGTLSVSSKLNEPMKALLEIKDVPADSSKVKVGLASQVVYRSLGKTYADELRDITVSLVSTNPYRLRIESTQPVRTADFPIILVLDDDGRRAAKLYNLHFADRKSGQPAQEVKNTAETRTAPKATAAAAASASVSQKAAQDREQAARAKPALAKIPSAATGKVPSASTAQTAVAKSSQAVKEQKPAAAVQTARQSAQKAAKEAAKPAAVAKNDVKAAAQKTREAVKPAAQKVQAAAKTAQSKSVPEVKKPAKTVASKVANIPLKGKSEAFKVQPGITLWSTVKPYVTRYPGAVTQQLIVQTIRDNPSCFNGGKASGVVFGCRMVLPKTITVSKEEALFYVNKHPDWDATKPVDDQIAAHAAGKQAAAEAPAVPAAEAAPVVNAAPAEKVAEKAPEKAAEKAPEKAAEEKPTAAEERKDEPAAQPQATKEQAAPKQQPQPAETAPVAPEQKPVQTEVKAKEPVQDAVKPAEPEKKAAAAEQKPVQQAKDADKSESPMTLILGLVLALLAAIGVGYNMIKRRKAEPAAQDASAAPVEFRRPEPTTQEQLDGASKMVENRLEADEAAARGFPDEAGQSAGEQSSETRGDSQTVPSVPAGMVAVESEETLLAKIDQARAYMAVGSNAKAAKQLEEVIKTSTGRIQQKATELLALLEQKK